MAYKDRAKALEYAHKYYEVKKRLGICVTCGKEMAFPPYVRCPACIEKQADRNAKRYNKKNKAKSLAASREYLRQRRKQRKEAGICPVCGKNTPLAGKVWCEICLMKHKRYDAQRERKRS